MTIDGPQVGISRNAARRLPLRLLILEDGLDDAELMLLEIRRAGFDPLWRRVDSENAFISSLSAELDIILADYSLPHFDASHALDLLQRSGLDVPFIVVTALISEEVAVDCMRRGATDYLLKDRLSRLGEAVRRALDAREARRERARAELELRRAKADLEVKVAERTADLTKANERLRVELAERNRAERSLRFLSEASEILVASLDYEVALRGLACLAVPHLADACTVSVLEAAEPRLIAMACADSHLEAALRDGVGQLAAGLYPGTVALGTGRPQIYTGSHLEEPSEDGGAAVLLAKLGFVSSIAVPLVIRSTVLGVLCLGSTRSDRRYADHDLDLLQDVAHRASIAVENARLYHQVQAAVNSRDELLASISHDLKNPLTAIKATAQLFSRQLLRGLAQPDRVAAALDHVDLKATKMCAQIDELVDVARLQMGRTITLDRRPVDLVAVARQMVDEQRQSQDKRLFAFVCEEPELVGQWDSARLERVIGNLLSNAVKYCHDGGHITVTLTRQRQPDGDWATLSVADDGIGIPEADLPHVFERFHRGANVAGIAGGTGIGLASANQIVVEHAGTIAVASTEGVGSVFTVRLPLNVPTSPSPTQPPP